LKDVVVTAIPLYHIFATDGEFIPIFAVGADNWLVANPRDMTALVQNVEPSQAHRVMGRKHAVCGVSRTPENYRGDFSNLRFVLAAVVPP